MFKLLFIFLFVTTTFACNELGVIGNITSKCQDNTWYVNGIAYLNSNLYGHAVIADDTIINGELIITFPQVLHIVNGAKIIIYGNLSNTGLIILERPSRCAIFEIYGNATWMAPNQQTASIMLIGYIDKPKNYYIACVKGITNKPYVIGDVTNGNYKISHILNNEQIPYEIDCRGTSIYYRVERVEPNNIPFNLFIIIICPLLAVLFIFTTVYFYFYINKNLNNKVDTTYVLQNNEV